MNHPGIMATGHIPHSTLTHQRGDRKWCLSSGLLLPKWKWAVCHPCHLPPGWSGWDLHQSSELVEPFVCIRNSLAPMMVK